MASNYTQPQPSENSPLDASLDANLEDHDARLQRRFNQAFGAARMPNNGHQSYANLPNFNFAPTNRILNDAYLIQGRRIYSNQKARKCFDSMCEDKVSKYKLEEVHFSLPSSVKSTFIMTFSPDGRKVASTHGDHRIYICDLNTGKLLDTLEGHPKTPWCLAWHRSNRNILASGCLAGEVRVWDLRSKACESWTSENNTIITSLDFHPKERVLVIATANDIYFWDWSDSDPFAKTTTTHDKEKVKFVEFDSSGTKLVTGISNLPKFAGYSGDSLQNRIIDSYLNQGTLDQLPTENMTQHSEIANNPMSGNPNPNSNENFNDRNLTQASSIRQLVANASNNTEQDINYRSTLTLSRVAFLYRQLEGLEDSMRHTSFSPYISPQVTDSTGEQSDSGLTQSNQEESDNLQSRPAPLARRGEDDPRAQDKDKTPSHQSASQGTSTKPQTSQSNDNQSNRSGISPHAFEPFLVSFDECLEQLQLPPLVVDGQTVSLATVIEQYPVEIPYQLHYVMQFESINQVNQNFIRISKLMSSVKLYRQIVQQILASNSGHTHYQPNQILTAQSASPRSSRNASNLPIVFRDFAINNHVDSAPTMGRSNRPSDPVLAIQYRQAARNVPLVTVCKIDLLSARSVCTMRSQQLIEQTLSSLRQQGTRDHLYPESNSSTNARQDMGNERHHEPSTSSTSTSDNDGLETSFYPLLKHLHQSLTNINHAPLTTSNVHSHITSLRVLIKSLLRTLSSMFRFSDEGRRLKGLIHDIAHSLTGRSWTIPLGATLNDIRLDVIHTLCIVDLTLHLTRQVQLLQMQRLSALTRIEESMRSSSNRDPSRSQNTPSANTAVQANSQQVTLDSDTNSHFDPNAPSTSRVRDSNTSGTKRKDSDESPVIDDSASKKRKMDTSDRNTPSSNSANNMIETDGTSTESTASANHFNVGGHSIFNTSANPTQTGQAPVTQNSTPDSFSSDRLVLWNSTHTQAVEQSLQRFLVATTSSMNNSHILVRIYHRLYGSSTIPSNSAADQSTNRSSPLPYESRRRALSQDNSTVSGTLDNANATGDEVRARLNQQTPPGVGNPSGFDALAGSRHPHLHIYQTRGSGPHLWFNQYTIPLPVSNCNYRIQCWNFSLSSIPNIKDSQSNVVTQKCRIHNDSSIDVSSDGGLIACLVPRDDGACIPSFDLKVFSLKTFDFGACYYQLPHGSNAISVSLSPSANYAVVGLASTKFISNDPGDDDITIAKVFKLSGEESHGFIRDIKIKRDDSSLSLNAIRWMPRGIVYNVGPQHHQRYQAQRMRNRIA